MFKLPSYINSKTIDTTFIFNLKTKTQTKFFKLKQKDQTIMLDKFKKGKYFLTLAGSDYLINEYPFVICSKCTNNIDLTRFPNQRSVNTEKFSLILIDINPAYIGGDIQLRADFLKSYSQEEIQILKSIKKFKIEGFLTAKLEICDVTFFDTNLDDNKKELLLKGLKNLKNWHTARVNGKSVDGKFVLVNFHLQY